MPYDEFGNPYDRQERAIAQLVQERCWRWFTVGLVIGLIFGIAITM